ncbi:hypothetical protein [Pollutimonas sp. M17]|uniref:hypothetical protein n=1 Tax=Pollutimonas sp. M17 TaxID=2962065 RepID=UPI0021F3F06D|nr:hypothetical protein [Pollutimonas sp. M17]UYO95045.1 hypothetical protein OEG81_06985 [Pollutimonas sp. M17]
MIKRMAVCASLAGILVGCANTQWYNHNYSAGDAELIANQKAVDEGYCTQVAHGAAPMPDARVYAPAQQSYNITGTISSYGQGGFRTSNYSGYVTPSPGSAFSSGVAQGAALGASIRARRAQDAIMKGCMIKLGWTDKPPTEEQASTSPVSYANNGDKPKGIIDEQKYVELSCSSHRKLAGSIDKLMRDGVPKEDALNLMLTTSKNNKISHQSAAYLLWSTNTRYSAPEVPTENFVDFITDYCAQGWPDVKP